MDSKLIKDLRDISVNMRGKNDNVSANRIDQAIDEIKWASGEFTGIRLYTNDGKIAVACAAAEERLNH